MPCIACTPPCEDVEIDAPHFTERIAAAERLLTHRRETPALADDDRLLLLDTLHAAGQASPQARRTQTSSCTESHMLGTSWVPQKDCSSSTSSTCCRGPVEFDVAHVPDEVSAHYPGVDQALVQECRRLVLAMVAAWRWDHAG